MDLESPVNFDLNLETDKSFGENITMEACGFVLRSLGVIRFESPQGCYGRIKLNPDEDFEERLSLWNRITENRELFLEDFEVALRSWIDEEKLNEFANKVSRIYKKIDSRTGKSRYNYLLKIGSKYIEYKNKQ